MNFARSRSIRLALAGVLFAAAAALLWHGVAPPAPASTAAGAKRKAIDAYLARLGRIDAAVETSERRGWRIIHAHGPGVRRVPPWG